MSESIRLPVRGVLVIVMGVVSGLESVAVGEIVGPGLVNRANVDTASNYLFLHDNGTPGFTQTGLVTSWSFFNDNGSGSANRTIEPVILKQVGATYVVTGVGAPVTTPSTMAGVQTFPFTLVSGSPVVGPGYTFAHHDLGNPGAIEWDAAAAGTGTHRYLAQSASPEILGTPLSGFSGRDRVYSVQFSTAERPMVTSGNALIDRPVPADGAVGGIFIDTDPFTVKAQLLEWALYDNDNFSPDRQITPLVLEQVGNDYFVRGVGATRTTTERGEQHYLFDLVAGWDIVGPGYFFGWRDGSLTTINAGVIDWTDGVGGVRYFGTPATFGLNSNLGAGTFYARDYSFQTTQVIPEPSSLALLGIAASLLPWTARRLRRQQSPPNGCGTRTLAG